MADQRGSERQAMEGALADAIARYDVPGAERLAREALAVGLTPAEVVRALSAGMRQVGDLWNRMELFLPEVIIAARAFYAGLGVVRPRMAEGAGGGSPATMVIGTIYGDVHTVGKDVAVPVFEAEGFRVVDLGIDVKPARYLEAIREHRPQVVGLGTYMSETFMHVRDLVQAFEEAGVRDRFLLVCGGPSVDSRAAKRMGADDAFRDAWVAVQEVKRMLVERFGPATPPSASAGGATGEGTR